MPWSSGSFRSKHNHKLRGAAAGKAASMANAMIREGVPEDTAIATANKKGDQMMRSGANRRKALYDRKKA